MPARKKCVKCELHGEDEFYIGGHVRRCPYRLCPCKNCQEHDQLLDRSRREQLKRREIRDKRKGEGLLSNEKVKLLRRQMDSRRSGGGEFNNNGSGSSNNTEEEPIVLSSDTEGYSTDVDDHDDPIDGEEYLSDDLPEPGDRSCAKAHAGNLRLNHSIFSNLREFDYIFTPPRPPATTSTPVMRQTTATTSISSTSPPVWTLSPTSSSTSPLVKKKHDAPVMVTLSSDSEEEQNFLSAGVGSKDWPQYLDKDQGCHLTTRSFEVEAGIKRLLPKEDEYADVDELLNDTTDEDENKTHELDFTKTKILQCTADDDEPAKAEISNAPDKEGNHNNNYKNRDEAKHESRLDMPKKRPSRWDIPPPGLTRSQLSAPPPPVHHVAQVPIPPHLRGLLLGKGGHFIHKLRVLSGAAISLGPVYCTIEGSCGGVGVARKMIAERLKLRMF